MSDSTYFQECVLNIQFITSNNLELKSDWVSIRNLQIGTCNLVHMTSLWPLMFLMTSPATHDVTAVHDDVTSYSWRHSSSWWRHRGCIFSSNKKECSKWCHFLSIVLKNHSVKRRSWAAAVADSSSRRMLSLRKRWTWSYRTIINHFNY